MTENDNHRKKLLRFAFLLSLITIFYNLAEGIVSVYFGIEDETLSLFGFGADSFAEVISGTGIAHMIWRIQRETLVEGTDRFEKQALRITGFSFYLLAGGLIISAIFNIIQKSEPDTTIVGIVIAGISIVTMFFLLKYKLSVGRKLNSAPIIADANCTRACFYLSFILLASSLLYEVFKIPYVDALGAIAIAWFSIKEGREAFEKARSGDLLCCDDDCQ